MRSRSRFTARWTALVLAVALGGATALFAVTDEEIFREFRFNLTNPGARSLALGGAFIAVADDATASLANPAGLMLLARPEFFTEMRDSKADSATIEQSIGAETIRSTTEPRAVFSPSFVSYVHPWKRFAAGVSRVELNKATNATGSLFSLAFDANNPSNIFALGGTGTIETDLSVWNATGAMKVGEKISVGATVALGILNIHSAVSNTLTNTDPNSFNPNVPQTLYTTSINDNDTSVSFNAGVHWRPFSKLSFGAVYRGGLKFRVNETIANDGFFGGGFATLAAVKNPFTTNFNTPDSWGAGAAWRPLAALTVSADWVHIQYTDILGGFQAGLNVLTLFDPNAIFKLNDADEFHLGGEWVFTAGSIPWAVRGGAYSEHNSRIFADFVNNQSFASNNHSFPGRDTITHWTGGTGVVVKDRFQIDVAADISRIAKQYVVSTIFRF